MNRRDFMAGVISAAALTKTAFAQENAPQAEADTHSFGRVITLAQERAQSPDKPDLFKLAGAYADLSYDQYRGIRFRRSADPIQAGKSQFGLDLLPPGHFFKERVRISLVKNGKAEEIAFDPTLFDYDPNQFDASKLDFSDEMRQGLGWSGFRLRYPINSPDYLDEFAVFQGASYFRAIARDTLYGLSARGLALGTGGPNGEEFPRFTQFWIYQPGPDDRSIHLEALLESASLTGAYAMEIIPGAETVFLIKSSLFPRKDIEHYGIAPLTSMYFFSPSRRAAINDYRNAVHDNDGLAIYTGAEARLWRPLCNPQTLQFSAFIDDNPKGFGLLQRARAFDNFQDAEARYDKRPSAWVTPRGNWNKGSVSLVEIPVTNEFNDNIIAFWSPAEPLKAGQRHDFAYDLTWSQTGPEFSGRARISGTRSGAAVNNPELFTFTVDFTMPEGTTPLDPDTLKLSTNASVGEISGAHLVRLPEAGKLRAAFDYRPKNNTMAELQLRLTDGKDVPVTESWYYRWVPL